MNIITIKTGQFYDPEYTEYVLKTTKDHHEIFDKNLNAFINVHPTFLYESILS